MQAYFPGDGHLLDWDMVDCFENMPYYIETEQFICVHAGLPLDPQGVPLPLKEASIERLVFDRNFKEPNVLPKTKKCILFGHTPASYVSGQDRILCYPRVDLPKGIQDFYKIHLDIGTMTSGIVGCFCMETGEIFYVKKSGAGMR